MSNKHKAKATPTKKEDVAPETGIASVPEINVKPIGTSVEIPEDKLPITPPVEPTESTPASEATSGTPDVQDDADMKKAVIEGYIKPSGEDAKETIAILGQPLVPAINGGKPVYKTALQAEEALAAQGKLTTPSK